MVPNSHSRNRVRRWTITGLVLTILKQLGAMSPMIQKLILHLAQPMILGGLFLVGIILSDHPLSFIGVGFLTFFLIGYVSRAIWKDSEEKEEMNQILEAIQRENEVRQVQLQIEQETNQKESNSGRENSSGSSENPPFPSHQSEESSSVGIHRHFSGSYLEGGSAENSERDSLSSRGRRYSSSTDDVKALYFSKPTSANRNRTNSMESTGSLPFRIRGTSMDSVGSGDFVWRSPSYQADYFNDLIIDEEEDNDQSSKYENENGSEDTSDDSNNEEDQEVILKEFEVSKL